jgi:hypothetical protein
MAPVSVQVVAEDMHRVCGYSADHVAGPYGALLPLGTDIKRVNGNVGAGITHDWAPITVSRQRTASTRSATRLS